MDYQKALATALIFPSEKSIPLEKDMGEPWMGTNSFSGINGGAALPADFSGSLAPALGNAYAPYTGFAYPGLLNASPGAFAPPDLFGSPMVPGSGYVAPTVTGPLS